MANEKRLYVVQDGDYGMFWCGLNKWDKQLRKAQFFHSLKWAKDIVKRYKKYNCKIIEVSMSILGEVTE